MFLFFFVIIDLIDKYVLFIESGENYGNYYEDNRT